MKKAALLGLLILLLVIGGIESAAGTPKQKIEINSTVRKNIKNQIEVIEESLNRNEIDPILEIVLKESLKEEIENRLKDKDITEYSQTVEYMEVLKGGKVRVITDFSASGKDWSAEGINYYVFKKSDGSWMLVNTNFHKTMDLTYIFTLMKKFIGLLFLPFKKIVSFLFSLLPFV